MSDASRSVVELPPSAQARIQQWSRTARRIRVPLGFLFAAIYLWHLYYGPPSFASLGLSLFLVVPGALLRAYASGYVKKNAELATTGPYAYTRNPLYLGSMLMAFGFALASRSVAIVLLLAVLFTVIYWPTILSEEIFLREAFPEYAAYARRVPRLIPGLTRGQAGVGKAAHLNQGRFSAQLYRKHREYNSALGAIAMYAALLLRIFIGSRHF